MYCSLRERVMNDIIKAYKRNSNIITILFSLYMKHIKLTIFVLCSLNIVQIELILSYLAGKVSWKLALGCLHKYPVIKKQCGIWEHNYCVFTTHGIMCPDTSKSTIPSLKPFFPSPYNKIVSIVLHTLVFLQQVCCVIILFIHRLLQHFLMHTLTEFDF